MRPITAADLMNPEVLTVPQNMTIRELARYLTDNQITGAPVEDLVGKLVGVVSVVDIAAVASDAGNVRTDRSSPDFYVRGWEDKLTPEEMKDFRVDNEDLQVGEIMTPDGGSLEGARWNSGSPRCVDGRSHSFQTRTQR